MSIAHRGTQRPRDGPSETQTWLSMKGARVRHAWHARHVLTRERVFVGRACEDICTYTERRRGGRGRTINLMS